MNAYSHQDTSTSFYVDQDSEENCKSKVDIILLDYFHPALYQKNNA